METSRLRNFLAVFETGSLRKAAETRNISASALSKSIHNLQDSIGVELFRHTGIALVLTPAGQTLVHRIAPIINEIDDITHNLQSQANITQEQPLRLVTFEVFSTYFLEGLDYINLSDRKIYLYEGEPGQIETAVGNNQADIGITYIPEIHQKCEHLKTAQIEMGVFTRHGSFLGISQKELPFVVPIYPLIGNPTKMRGLDGWPKSTYDRKVRYRVSLLESALELCRQGKAAGYFPVFIAELHNQKYRNQFNLERRRLDNSGNRCYCDVYIVKRKSSPENSDIRKIAKMVRVMTKHKHPVPEVAAL